VLDNSLLSFFLDLGLQPTEILIIGMLWRNIQNNNELMVRLVNKVNGLERQVDKLSTVAKMKSVA
jgi:hypothetical protein